MATLSQRLQKVQEGPTEAKIDFSQYTMEQLENTKIQFGKTHVGKTYHHMWCHEQSWVLWFTQHYHRSAKWEHRRFLHYVDEKIEWCERTGTRVPMTSASSLQSTPPVEAVTQVPMPKAKSRAITPGETQNRVWDFEEDPELFEVEVVPDQETNTQVTQMEARMANMENAINRIVQHLEEVAQSHTAEQ